MENDVAKQKQEVGTDLADAKSGELCTIELNLDNPLVLEILAANFSGGIEAANEILKNAQATKTN